MTFNQEEMKPLTPDANRSKGREEIGDVEMQELPAATIASAIEDAQEDAQSASRVSDSEGVPLLYRNVLSELKFGEEVVWEIHDDDGIVFFFNSTRQIFVDRLNRVVRYQPCLFQFWNESSRYQLFIDKNGGGRWVLRRAMEDGEFYFTNILRDIQIHDGNKFSFSMATRRDETHQWEERRAFDLPRGDKKLPFRMQVDMLYDTTDHSFQGYKEDGKFSKIDGLPPCEIVTSRPFPDCALALLLKRAKAASRLAKSFCQPYHRNGARVSLHESRSFDIFRPDLEPATADPTESMATNSGKEPIREGGREPKTLRCKLDARLRRWVYAPPTQEELARQWRRDHPCLRQCYGEQCHLELALATCTWFVLMMVLFIIDYYGLVQLQ